MSEDKELSKLEKQAEEAQISNTEAGDIMNTDVITLSESSKIYTAVSTLATKKISGAPVVDNLNRLKGVITEYDLLLQTATKDVSKPIEYTKKVVTIQQNTTIREIIVLFYKTKVKWFPVVNKENKVLGIVARIDVLNRLIKPKGK